jgi:hypothetical protein
MPIINKYKEQKKIAFRGISKETSRELSNLDRLWPVIVINIRASTSNIDADVSLKTAEVRYYRTQVPSLPFPN